MTTENNEIRNRDYRRFLLSAQDLCHLDCGFINIKSCNSLTDIVNIARNNALEKLLDINMNEMYERVMNMKIHIHDFTLDEIKNSNRDQVYYICSHCT